MRPLSETDCDDREITNAVFTVFQASGFLVVTGEEQTARLVRAARSGRKMRGPRADGVLCARRGRLCHRRVLIYFNNVS